MEKLLFVDTQTVNVDRSQGGIWQLAGAVMIDGEIKETFNFEMDPGDEVDWDQACLQIYDDPTKTEVMIRSYDDQAAVFFHFQDLLSKYVDRYDKKDKFHLVAYNAAFDDSKLRAWWKLNNDEFYGAFFWSNTVCVMNLASWVLMTHRHKLPNFKLGTVCSALDVELANAHDAADDITATIQIFQMFEKLLQ